MITITKSIGKQGKKNLMNLQIMILKESCELVWTLTFVIKYS